MRHFGGLHSRVFDSRVQVAVNDRVIDGFGLRKRPKAHSDYFHRLPKPRIPLAAPFRDCQTLYAWPLQKDHLDGQRPTQRVSVSIDRNAWWDIDFVGLVSEVVDPQHDVFVSHSWRDKRVARKLAADLERRGIRVWIDEAEMGIGDSLLEKVGTAIDSVEYLLALLSRASVKSKWVRRELEIAMSDEIDGRRVKVMPVLIEDCKIPPFLRGKLYADMRAPDAYDRVVSQLCESMKVRRKQ